MKKIAAMVLAGVLAAVPVSTTGAAEFQDGADTQNFIWAAGEETSTDTDESKGVSANDSVVEGLDKPLVFYPNTYYKFNVTGAGTQNTNPVEGDVRWTPLYWSLSLKPQRYSQEMGNRFCKGYLYKGGTCIQYICLFPERRIYRRYMGEKRYCTTCEISVQCSSVN